MTNWLKPGIGAEGPAQTEMMRVMTPKDSLAVGRSEVSFAKDCRVVIIDWKVAWFARKANRIN